MTADLWYGACFFYIYYSYDFYGVPFDDLCGVFVFFFSSRRRHTRFKCDWSSDVCSSDLGWGGKTLGPPIFGFSRPLAESAASRTHSASSRSRDWRASQRLLGSVASRSGLRSEERRGGEEGRSRWAPDHLKKKKKRVRKTC